MRALDQMVMEQLQIARDPRERPAGSAEAFRDFLLRMVRSGPLAAGQIEPLHAAFYKTV